MKNNGDVEIEFLSPWRRESMVAATERRLLEVVANVWQDQDQCLRVTIIFHNGAIFRVNLMLFEKCTGYVTKGEKFEVDATKNLFNEVIGIVRTFIEQHQSKLLRAL